VTLLGSHNRTSFALGGERCTTSTRLSHNSLPQQVCVSDRTSSRLGMRRPWMIIGLLGGSLGILVVALAPSVPVVLAGWRIAQLSFNAVLAALVAVLPDQVPEVQRGTIAGALPSSIAPAIAPVILAVAAATACYARSQGSAPSPAAPRSCP